MHFISLLGLVILLFCAWLMSYHKSKINFKQIFWGIGLQFVFAIIILKSDNLSFVGMAIFGLLLINFFFRDFKLEAFNQKWQSIFLVSIASILVGAALYYLTQLTDILFTEIALATIVVILIANTILKLLPSFQKFAGALLIIFLVLLAMQGDYYGQRIFKTFSDQIAYFLSLSDFGAQFLFGNLANSKYFFTDGSYWPGFGFQFAFKVLPTIIFFGGFMGVLYYLGIMQLVIEAMSKFMRWSIGTSGAETMSCTANIFVGQTEAPLLIKPFIAGMTNSELLTVMVGGFATIAGGVLAGYIAMGVPAGHLVAASVMAAPAALVVGKIIFPEMEHSQTAGDVKLPAIDVGSNVLESASNGIIDGMKLAANVGAMLIGFIALIAVVDLIMNFLDMLIDGKLLGGNYVEYAVSGMTPANGEYVGYFPGSLKTFFGTILRPLAWTMGVPWEDAANVGNLLGIKLSLNEFVAYGNLTAYMKEGVMSERAVTIATYALCGFANFSSIGIQIGGISALAPNRKSDLARIGLKAMFGGAIASALTATIAGILI